MAARLARLGRLPALPMFRAAQTHQRRVAVVDGAGSHTYAQLLADAQRVRAALGRSVGGGASVAMLMPSTYEYVAVQWGIWAAGGAVVPLSPAHPERELEFFIADSAARHVICHPSLSAPLRRVLERMAAPVRLLPSDELVGPGSAADAPGTAVDDGPDSPPVGLDQNALFIYTSGTTGRPKGVVHTHATLAAQLAALHEAWRWSPADRLLHVLPLHHVHGIVVALAGALWAGATAELLPRFDAAQVLARLVDGPQDVSLLMGVPTMYARLLQAIGALPDARRRRARDALARLRLTVSGSAALPAAVFRAWHAATGQTMLERYGMSETGMVLSNDAADPAARVPGAVGRPLPAVDVRLVDDAGADVTARPDVPGVLHVRGPAVFREYYGLPDKTASEFTPDGWFVTGDVAARDAAGVYRIMGRLSTDIVKSGGFKLSALEIERDLLEHPDIADVAVVGLPSDEWGEAVAAAVVLRPGAAPLPLADLKPWCRERMAHYKIPKALVAVDALPRNLMGKLDKKAVKCLF
ncbi:hypothetical protein H4R18_002303 [Coemansia javaensis]|uniref:Uncharacterized protein n=1 Tax=Coemansia javaensis TaxID=2761396 RepID=A0A9W8LIX7_9FUNG|nr:hypothetical protein H4R18_002303 [Coemansia javaensis]